MREWKQKKTRVVTTERDDFFARLLFVCFFFVSGFFLCCCCDFQCPADCQFSRFNGIRCLPLLGVSFFRSHSRWWTMNISVCRIQRDRTSSLSMHHQPAPSIGEPVINNNNDNSECLAHYLALELHSVRSNNYLLLCGRERWADAISAAKEREWSNEDAAQWNAMRSSQ